MNGEKECDQDQLRKANKSQKELKISVGIKTFQKDWKQLEISAVDSSRKEEKYLF